MKNGKSPMEWLVGLIFFLMLLPFFVSLALSVLSTALRMFLVFLAAILPWIIALVLLIGIVAGGIAGLIIRGRLPRGNREYLPPGGPPPVKRPRGPGRDDDD
jgi:hypothetical protein